MKKKILLGLLSILISQWTLGQQFPKITPRNYVSDTTKFTPRRPWLAASEAIGLNLVIWGADRYIAKADFAYISLETIKNNFKTGPVWDTDMFSTNLVAHPYHGSLYFNAARSNGMNFWQAIPFTVGGSFMWEFFMENEPPSINDLIATTFGGIELGEITYRLSDIFLDDRTIGSERVGREILSGLISPIRGINRVITGEAWQHSVSKGRTYTAVPINFIVNVGPRFLAEQEKSNNSTTSMNVSLRLDYGDPFNHECYSPYEWFQLRAGFDFLSSQPLISQVNAIGVLWGKNIWSKGDRTLTTGVFQHFDYYNSQLDADGKNASPYRISEAAAVGGGLMYNKKANEENKTDVYAEFYANGVALGASASDYFMVHNRDYNMGSGYSIKSFVGLTYNKRWSFLINLENYHIFTWKGYDPNIDWETVDPDTLNVQGDTGNARLTVFATKLAYASDSRWNITLTNRYFSRRTHYKYHDHVERSTYDVMLNFGVRI